MQVFERSPVPLEGRGAGIVLHPVTARIFEDHGLLDLERVSASATTLRYLTAEGETLLEERIAYRFTSYGTLYAALLGFQDPERYHLGKEFAGFEDQDGRVRIRFADGATDEADLLVGADGIRSTVRGLLFPDARPVYAGYVAWRGTLDDAQLPAAAEGLRGLLTYHIGDHTHVLSYDIPEERGTGRSMNWVWYRNVSAGAPLDRLLTDRRGVQHDLSLSAGAVADACVDELEEAAGRLPPAFRELIRATWEPFVQVIVDVEVPAMVRGRVCLVGDAAFTLRPHVAAGTAKAAANARALAEAMAEEGSDVCAALARWEPAQLALGRSTTQRTREVGERAQVSATFEPGDPQLALGLWTAKDHNFAPPSARSRGGPGPS